MTEEQTQSVNNQEAAIPEVKSESQEQIQAPKVEEKENSKEINFAKLRKKMDELERQNNELKLAFSQKTAPPPELDELDSLGEDDIITLKQAKKLANKMAKETVTKTLEEREKALLPERTRQQFADYDQVMSIDNVKKFEQEEPGLAAACMSAPNPWEATYKMLKKFVLPTTEKKADKMEDRMKDNLSKPVSSNSIGRQGPLANANLWAEASKEELNREMMEAARRG